MALLELGFITGKLADWGLDEGFKALGRTEAAIRARQRLGMPSAPDAGEFGAIYRHALVRWGVFKPEPVLDFFRDKRIVDAFEQSYHQGDPAILRREAAAVVQWAEEYGTFRGLEYDPRREFVAFAATFEEVADYTRTAVEIRQDHAHERQELAHEQLRQAMERMERRLDEAMTLLAGLQTGQVTIGDITLSGDFSGSILNLLARLEGVTQTVHGGYLTPPLPPLDEHGRPPLPAAVRDLPPHSRLSYDRNPLFTGREDELRQLARRLLYAPAGVPAVIGTGIGGIGKTQLAVEFAFRYGRYFAGGVQWVSLAPVMRPDDPTAVDEAATREAVAGEVIACGAAMGCWTVGQEALLSAAEKLARTQRHWAGPEPRLIIFDNCEDRALLEAWRPVGGGARALVTSRNDTWPAGYAQVPVRMLPRVDSLRLLREYTDETRPKETDAALDVVAATLDDLPLALTLAGSVLAAYPSLTVADYLADLNQPDLLRRLLPEPDAQPVSWTKHDLDVARTFAVSFDRLLPEEDETDAVALMLLVGATCLVHGEPFPRALLTGMLPGGDPRPAERAVNRLLALGLLERSGVALRLHRLIGRFVVEEVARRDTEVAEGEGLMATVRAAVEVAVIQALSQANKSGDPRSLRGVEIHLRHVVDQAIGREDAEAALLNNELGYYLRMSGDLAGARPYYERALAIRERVLGPEHPDTAGSLNNKGYLLRAMGDLAGARPYYERALTIRERVLGPEHPDTATSLNNLGALLDSMGDLAGARPYYERALAISERVLGPEHPDTALSLNNLGGLLQAMGDLAGARPYYERALGIRERVLGPEHPDTAQSLNNLGALLDSMGDLAGARSYYERALAISERVLGPEHPDTAQSLNNMGYLLQAMGDLAGARPYYERALAIRERVLGPEHPDTALSLNNLGYLLQAMGDLAGARPYFERALAIRERVLGPEHPDTARSLNNMGYLLDSMGDLAGARPYYERALAIWERVLGSEHPQTATAVNNLGMLLQAMGDLAGARPYLERALAIRERVLGPEHPHTATSLNNMGGLLQSMDDLAGARPYFERALAIFEAKLGPNHPNTRIVRGNLARVS